MNKEENKVFVCHSSPIIFLFVCLLNGSKKKTRNLFWFGRLHVIKFFLVLLHILVQ